MSRILQPGELFSRTVAFGIMGASLLNTPKAGVRKPFSADRKAKARKAARIAAESRRRNRQ